MTDDLNLTRREFLKDLGLLGAGVSLTPMFDPLHVQTSMRQLDDSWVPEGTARAPWVKTVDQPTMEVDWKTMQRFSETHTLRHEPQYLSKDQIQSLNDLKAKNLSEWLKAGKPGYSLKDVALQTATTTGLGQTPLSFLGPTNTLTPDKRGVPKWTGAPEEAAQIVTAALRHLGAATVGFVELDPNTTQKLIYAVDPDGKELVFSDVEQPSETDKQRIIPNKARWAIVYTIQMSGETLSRAPTILGAQTTTLTYSRFQFIQPRLQSFLQSLGYMALGEASINALGIAPALAVMAGLGEESRLNRLITPEYGPMVREYKMVTDLPLAPTKPIDFGVMEFCKHCKICAEACPSKALSMADEPTWQVQGGWNNPGHKAFFENSPKCYSYWSEIGTNCGICFASCPFANSDKALVHQLTQATIATVPAADGLLKSLHDLTYGPTDGTGKPLKDPETWWKLDLAEDGIDTTRGHRDI
jgi:epoxyqueuosine reductase